jgi:hypothetical protein
MRDGIGHRLLSAATRLLDSLPLCGEFDHDETTHLSATYRQLGVL